jgi:hypothetical protein
MTFLKQLRINQPIYLDLSGNSHETIAAVGSHYLIRYNYE